MIRPGVRWRRGNRFPDDPDVERLYLILYEQGAINADGAGLPDEVSAMLREANPVARFLEDGRYVVDFERQDALQHALARRAGEDGHGILGHIGGRVVLGLPLDQADIDPWPEIHRLAVTHYTAMLKGDTVQLGPLQTYNPFAGVYPVLEIIAELERRAHRDGHEIARRPASLITERVSLAPRVRG
ncbi:MAG TPA: hypothetical protein VMT59_15925 [Gaiellaceae bacterium]|nr:hypothetical protein [Gaiellaceae bacterium]